MKKLMGLNDVRHFLTSDVSDFRQFLHGKNCKDKQTDKHNTHSHPGETHTHALGVNVKVSTLQGPDDPQIHP